MQAIRARGNRVNAISRRRIAPVYGVAQEPTVVPLPRPQLTAPAGCAVALRGIVAVSTEVRVCGQAAPKSYADSQRLFDHLVSLGEQQIWNLKAKGVGGLEVDHQLYLGAQLDWEVSWLGALENFSDVDPCLLN